MVAARIVRRDSGSSGYFRQNSVRRLVPQFPKRKADLIFALSEPSRRGIVDGVFLPTLIDSAMRIMSR